MKDKMEMIDWLACGARGTSSNTMVQFITGVKAAPHGMSHPLDPDDFSRCRRLCEQVSVIRENIDKMKQCSRQWAALVDHWQELCELMDKESPNWRDYYVSCPATYRLMLNLFEECKK
jgi:hypothetical protein